MEAGISIPSHEKFEKNLQVCGEIAPFRPVSGTHMQEIGEKLVGVSAATQKYLQDYFDSFSHTLYPLMEFAV